MNQLFKKT